MFHLSIFNHDKNGRLGEKSPVNNNVHITQTNQNAQVRHGAHVTTNISGTQAKVHDFFDSNGNHTGSGFGKR